MTAKPCLNLLTERKLAIDRKIVGVFSNHIGYYGISNNVPEENNSYQESILMHNYDDILVRAKENGETILISANNTYFLSAYEKFKDTVKLILLATNTNTVNVAHLKDYDNVMFVLLDLGDDIGLSLVQQGMLEDAVIINYAAKVCSTFLIFSLENLPTAILTVAIAEASFLGKKLRFTELKNDYVISGDVSDILENTQYCTDLLRTYRDLCSPIYSCNNYELFNIIFNQSIGRYKEFAPFLDTYHDLCFNLYNKSNKGMRSVEGF